MKNSQNKGIGLEDCDTLTRKGKAILSLIISSPLLIMGAVDMMNVYDNNHVKPLVKPYESYNLPVHISDEKPREIVPKVKPGEDLIKPYRNPIPDGLVLEADGLRIYTSFTSEDLLNQLSLDYQDLFDYYGGAEELY